MALMGWATHVLQWRRQRAATARAGANPEKPSRFGSRAATRPREGGIASNRGSARRGEYVPAPSGASGTRGMGMRRAVPVVLPPGRGEREKGIWWMPWRREATKDVARCEKPRGAASRLRSGDLRMGQPTPAMGYRHANP